MRCTQELDLLLQGRLAHFGGELMCKPSFDKHFAQELLHHDPAPPLLRELLTLVCTKVLNA